MSKESEVLTKLQQAQALLDECISEIQSRKSASRQGRKTSLNAPTNLPGHVLKLRDGGFFKQSKTIKEVHMKLQPTYECQFDRVAMALLRLQRRKQLRKASKKIGDKDQLAYVW